MEEDPALLAKKKSSFNKQITLSEDKESDAWQQLSTTMVYADVTEEEAAARWEGWRQGMQGFNAHARKLMEKDRVPRQKSVCAPTSDKAVVQPYQESVSWLVHPKSLPNVRLLVVHRTGAGAICSSRPRSPRPQAQRVHAVSRGR